MNIPLNNLWLRLIQLCAVLAVCSLLIRTYTKVHNQGILNGSHEVITPARFNGEPCWIQITYSIRATWTTATTISKWTCWPWRKFPQDIKTIDKNHGAQVMFPAADEIQGLMTLPNITELGQNILNTDIESNRIWFAPFDDTGQYIEKSALDKWPDEFQGEIVSFRLSIDDKSAENRNVETYPAYRQLLKLDRPLLLSPGTLSYSTGHLLLLHPDISSILWGLPGAVATATFVIPVICRYSMLHWRRRNNQCIKCGYDLNGILLRCPECGAEIMRSASTIPE